MRKSPRYLRITWTAFYGVACLLLITLWARSYWRVDGVNGQLSGNPDYCGEGPLHKLT